MKNLYVFLFVSLFVSISAADKKPNFVFFLVDDFGWGALSSMGSKVHETPNIDKLFSQGMNFSNGYAAGIAYNTYIIFTGDNGANWNDFCGGLKSFKDLSHEGGVREPFIISGPGLKPAVLLTQQ